MITKSSVIDRILDPMMTTEIASRIVALRADEPTQTRIDELASRCNEGQLTEDERTEYEAYVSAINYVSILQAKARRVLDQQGL